MSVSCEEDGGGGSATQLSQPLSLSGSGAGDVVGLVGSCLARMCRVAACGDRCLVRRYKRVTFFVTLESGLAWCSVL